MIPHFPEPTLCHIIWWLGFFNQMKTPGCLACYSTASPSSSITTSIWMGESSVSGTGKLQTQLFGGIFGLLSPWAREKLQQWEQFSSSLTIRHLLISSRTHGVSKPSWGIHLCWGLRRRVCISDALGWGRFFEGKLPSLPWQHQLSPESDRHTPASKES